MYYRLYLLSIHSLNIPHKCKGNDLLKDLVMSWGFQVCQVETITTKSAKEREGENPMNLSTESYKTHEEF